MSTETEKMVQELDRIHALCIWESMKLTRLATLEEVLREMPKEKEIKRYNDALTESRYNDALSEVKKLIEGKLNGGKVFCSGDRCSGLWNLPCDSPEHPKVKE